jgi:hypothetical protein
VAKLLVTLGVAPDGRVRCSHWRKIFP